MFAYLLEKQSQMVKQLAKNNSWNARSAPKRLQIISWIRNEIVGNPYALHSLNIFRSGLSSFRFCSIEFENL